MEGGGGVGIPFTKSSSLLLVVDEAGEITPAPLARQKAIKLLLLLRSPVS